MSDLELERSAMAPHRWIELCCAFEKQHHGDADAILKFRATRTIKDSFPQAEVDFRSTTIFIVPGGRYLVTYSPDDIFILDLGFTSNADCKLIASARGGGFDTCVVQATPDGMGLAIYSCDGDE